MRDAVLAIHITGGATGLLSGPIGLAPLVGGRDGAALRFYQLALAVVTSTAVALAVFHWRELWWLALIAGAIQAAAVAGGLLARPPDRAAKRAWRVRFLLGTYVGLVTALLVVSWGSPLAWLIPTVLGVPIVERCAALAARSFDSGGRQYANSSTR